MNKNLIFKQNPYNKQHLNKIIIFTILGSIYAFFIQENGGLGGAILFISFISILSLRSGTNYIIDLQGIHFYKGLSEQPLYSIPNSEISQVRFEDDFQTISEIRSNIFLKGFKVKGNDRIFIYPRPNSTLKVNRSGYIPLMIGSDKEADVILILNHFQQQNIDVKIKTDRQIINQETGLKNWNKVS